MGFIQSVDTIATVYRRIKTSYTGNDLIYQGFHKRSDADDGDTDWIIVKREYTANVYQQSQTLIGSWTGKAGLSWAF